MFYRCVIIRLNSSWWAALSCHCLQNIEITSQGIFMMLYQGILLQMLKRQLPTLNTVQSSVLEWLSRRESKYHCLCLYIQLLMEICIFIFFDTWWFVQWSTKDNSRGGCIYLCIYSSSVEVSSYNKTVLQSSKIKNTGILSSLGCKRI